MRVKVEFIKEGDENMSMSVETQHKRGEAFSIHKADMVSSGDTATFILPPSGRLVINMPTATEKPIYDREQGAAVLSSAQRQDREGADRPDFNELVKAKEQELDDLRAAQERQAAEDKAAEEERVRAAEQSQRAQQQGGGTPALRTPLQGGQPITGGSQPQGTKPNDAPVGSNESPNSKSNDSSPTPSGATANNAQPGVQRQGSTLKTTTTPNTTPAHGGAPQGGSTEKK